MILNQNGVFKKLIITNVNRKIFRIFYLKAKGHVDQFKFFQSNILRKINTTKVITKCTVHV